MKKMLVGLIMLLMGSVGCITTGSKDMVMIKTVADILVEQEEISPEDHGIIISVIKKYEAEEAK